jgi:hypothetical protein
MLVSDSNPAEAIPNSDLEMVVLLLLWLVTEEVCWLEASSHCALFSDNRRKAAIGSLVTAQLIRALALRLKLKGVSPLTPLHVEGKRNATTDKSSWSLGSEQKVVLCQ